MYAGNPFVYPFSFVQRIIRKPEPRKYEKNMKN